MKFITLQSMPSKQTIDENGKYKIEHCGFSKITVPVNKSLGFKPMWAIPITTFKETLASVFLTAPNYPILCCVFETDEYVRVDKIEYYRNLRDGGHDIPLADSNLPTHLCEYCLNIEKLPDTPSIMSSVILTEDLYSGKDVYENIISLFYNEKNDSELNEIMRSYIKRVPNIDKDLLIEQFTEIECANIEQRVMSINSWYKYRYTILPIILYGLCDDTYINTINDGYHTFANYAVESCIHSIFKLISIDREMAEWSNSDCNLDEYEKIYSRIFDIIIDKDETLKYLFGIGQPGRNDICPCGSGKKFKKCCGKYF